MRRSQLRSAAGLLKLPTARSFGSTPGQAAPKIKVVGEEIEIPAATKVEQERRRVPEMHASMEIDDVTTFSKRAVRQEVPAIVFFRNDTADQIDKFYANVQFETAKVAVGPNSTYRYQLPPQSRRKMPMPQFKILGVPEEW